MYSPKIKEAYIPVIYRLAKKRRMHMTTLVNEIIRKKLKISKRTEKRTCKGVKNGGQNQKGTGVAYGAEQYTDQGYSEY